MHTPFLLDIRRELPCLVSGKLLAKLAKTIRFGSLVKIDAMGTV